MSALPPDQRISPSCCSRRSMPWKLASARWMAASATPSSVATATAASELSTLCRPGKLMVSSSGGSPTRSAEKWVLSAARRTSTARTSAPSPKP
jgi:hypothetical protein